MKQSNNLTMNRGFSLVEMVVVVSIFAIVSVTISNLFINIYQSYKQTDDIRKITQDARYALDTISREARLAVNLDLDTTNNKITTTAQDGTQIVFQCNSCNNNGFITMQKGADPSQNLTSSGANITNFTINSTEIAKEGNSSNIQPFFKLRITAQSTESTDRTGAKPSVTLETIVSRRGYTF